MSKNLTCCTKKMEERYQVAARRDIQNLLQTSSSSLKYLIARNVAAFQGKSVTSSLLRGLNVMDACSDESANVYVDNCMCVLSSRVH